MTGGAPQPIDICVVASGDWASFSRVNCHEIAARWTAFGRVCYIEPAPMRAPRRHDLRRLGSRLSRVFATAQPPGGVAEPSSVEVVAPLFVPWEPVSCVRAWNVYTAARAVRRRAARLSWPFSFDVLWFFSLPLVGLEECVPHRLVVYHAVDDYAANPGVRRNLLRRRERELLSRADVVFAASEPLAARLRERHQNVVVWENVSDTTLLLASRPSSGNAVPQSRRSLAVYVGNLAAHKVDFPLVLEVVRRLGDWDFVLAGPVGDLPEAGRHLLREPNVRYVGPVNRADLPRMFEHADVALLPTPAGELHDSSFPIKLFDYLALGLPVVGRRTTPLMRFGDVIVHAGTVSEYVPAMEQARQLRQQASFRRRAQELARRNSWSDRIGALEGFLRKELVGKPLRDLPTT